MQKQTNLETPIVKDERLYPVPKREGDKMTMTKEVRIAILAVFVVLIVAGAGTGYLLATPGKSGGVITTQSIDKTGKTFGSTDTKTFTDTTIGVIEKGGTNGEGTHRLIRDGGPSQTACLVSSVLDLDQFVGKKVKVWSTTNDAKQCAWLMDVGRIELQ